MDKIIGHNLSKLRKANSYTQEQMAAFLNINRSTYSNYELGDREMPLDLLERAADLLGCELSLFFEENEAIVDEMMVCAFRIDNLSSEDLYQIATFKNIVKNYMKITQLLQE